MNKPLIIGDLRAEVPVVQGGMGVGISLSRLASAVANSGGIGIISAVIPAFADKHVFTHYKTTNIEALKREIRTARQLSPQGILGVNVMAALTNFEDMVVTALDEGVDLIISGGGLPLNLPSYLKPGQKTKLVPIVSSARALALIYKRWTEKYHHAPDAVIVEGPQSGGHQGVKMNEIDEPQFQLEVQLAQVRRLVDDLEAKSGSKLPIIAAGGIESGADIQKLFSLGADGVQIGTAFIGTKECDLPEAMKQIYFEDKGTQDVVVIDSPVGMPLRLIRTPFVESILRGEQKPQGCPLHCLLPCDFTKVSFCIAKALINAARGKAELGIFLGSAYTRLMNHLTTVPELFAQWKSEFFAARDQVLA